MRLTTTLNLIRKAGPCGIRPNKDGTLSGYLKLLQHVGDNYDADAEINLLTILESNGVQDTLWCLRATVQDSKRIAAQLAIEFAAEVLPIFEARYPNDTRVRDCIQGARDYLEGKITLEELLVLRRAAYAAAAYAAYAYAAAAGAAAAAYAAAYAVAADAYAYAYAAADARNKMGKRQADIIRSILEQ